ncbi:MAG: hypothetical protein SFU98_22280 [Leptospiraceae bacterium]|nr:hypothetical protein [Leptospiraceae bacterium]
MIQKLFYSAMLLLISFALFANIQKDSKPLPKIQITKSKPKCCPIGELSGIASLEAVCIEGTKTILVFQLEQNSEICSIRMNLKLIDNHGREYYPYEMKNIAECPNMTRGKKGHSFQWIFDKLDKSTTTIHVSEDNVPPPSNTTNWSWWEWKNIDIRKCNIF